MAIPLVPIVVLVVGAVMLGGGKRSRKKKVSNGGNGTAVTTGELSLGDPDYWPPPPTDAVTGDFCDPGPGKFGAVDSEGNCKTFFDYDQHMPVLKQAVREVWEEIGPADLCSLPPSVLLYPGTYLEEWVVEPEVSNIAKQALLRLYPELNPNTLPPPPPPDAGTDDVPYWLRSVWGFAIYATSSEICNWKPIT